jgi:hypothetical protein
MLRSNVSIYYLREVKSNKIPQLRATVGVSFYLTKDPFMRTLRKIYLLSEGVMEEGEKG